MKLAVNYSPQAVELLAAGSIEMDLFKCPDWPDLIATARAHLPVYVHFGLRAGDGSLEVVDWRAVEEWLGRTGTPYVNLHLEARTTDFPEFPDMPADPPDAARREVVVGRLRRDVAAAVRRFGPERVMVENVIYRGGDGAPPPGDAGRPAGATLRAAVEPAVIRSIVDGTGCGLLLDLPHARITARHLGVDEREYLSRLPVHRLRELHVTGVGWDGRRFRDHLALGDEDWRLLEWVLGQIREGRWARPWVLAFEYGGVGPIFEWRSEAPVLAAQVPRLLALVRATP